MTTRRRVAQATPAPAPRELTMAERAEHQQWLANMTRTNFLDAVGQIISTLREKADRFEQRAQHPGDLETLATQLMHELLWMVPNLNLEHLQGHARHANREAEAAAELHRAVLEEAAVLAMIEQQGGTQR